MTRQMVATLILSLAVSASAAAGDWSTFMPNAGVIAGWTLGVTKQQVLATANNMSVAVTCSPGDSPEWEACDVYSADSDWAPYRPITDPEREILVLMVRDGRLIGVTYYFKLGLFADAEAAYYAARVTITRTQGAAGSEHGMVKRRLMGAALPGKVVKGIQWNDHAMAFLAREDGAGSVLLIVGEHQ